jgi:hypothetical protein
LHSYGLVEGCDKLVVADIIVLLIEALRGIGAANNKLTHAHIKADDHNPKQRRRLRAFSHYRSHRVDHRRCAAMPRPRSACTEGSLSKPKDLAQLCLALEVRRRLM